jgi:spore coat protein A, manganese oxidase
MRLYTRRDFVRNSCASLQYLLSARTWGLGWVAQQPPNPLPHLERFIDPLPLLKRLEPVGKTNRDPLFRVRMRQFEQKLHSNLPATRLWGFEDQFPGPIIEAEKRKLIEVHWENQLPIRHLFEIDPRIHGAMPPVPAVRTVPHLHGARTASNSDGLPEQWFTPGSSVRYVYPNDQPAATLWYHDHAMGITRLNMYAGLAGLYLIRDDNERRMGLPAGQFEIPLVLQDRTVDAQGQLIYTPTFESGEVAPPGVWAPEFFGDFPVVNGAIYPYLDVEPRIYRLRVLNAANSRFFRIYFNLARFATDIPHLVGFHQIGSDGGFLPGAVRLEKLLLGPGERADLIVDFSGLAGKTITLQNDAVSPYPGWAVLNHRYPPLAELMQFRVALSHSGPSEVFSFPQLPFVPAMEAAAVKRTRDFILSEEMDSQGKSLGVRINNRSYSDPVTEVVELGATERWRFINATDDAHPMHLHLVQFRVVERQGFDPVALRGGTVQLIGNSRPPADNEKGWKDTAIVFPGEVLTVQIKFEGYTGRYVFHCHMLEHEDNEMMRPFEVVDKPEIRSGH